MKKSFIVHNDSLDILDELTHEQIGMLFLAMRAYQRNEEIELDTLVKIAFSPFKNQFDRDNVKYEKLCEKNKLIAENRYKKKPTKSTTGYQPLPTVTKSTDNDSDNDSKSDSDNVSDSKKEIIKKETKVSVYPYPPELNLPAWEEWKAYRRENKIRAYKPTPRSEGMAITKLLEISTSYDNQAEIIKESMSNSWSGLFPAKTKMTLQQSNQHVLENWNPDE